MSDEQPTTMTDEEREALNVESAHGYVSGGVEDEICVAIEIDNLKSIFEIIGSMTDLTPENAEKVFHVMSLISPYLIKDEAQLS